MNEQYMQQLNNQMQHPNNQVQQPNNQMQQPYGQPPYPSSYQAPVRQKGDGMGWGIAALVLGAVSVLLFGCCVNYILAILAVVFAIIQLVKNKPKGLAIAGIVMAVVSILLGTLMWIGVLKNVDAQSMDDMYLDPEYFYEEEAPYNELLEDYLDEL